MGTCPTCGQLIQRDSDAAELLKLLTNGTPHRQVYRAGNGSGWYVTYGGGQVSEEAVNHLLTSGDIQRSYSDCADCYHVGKTLDIVATLEARKGKKSKDWPKVYTDGTTA
jgi:hypothetical protein